MNLIYDALGRMVEQQNGSAYTQMLYSQIGKTAIMTGQTLSKAFVSLPGGGTAIFNSSGLAYYRHADWLGSSRLTSTPARAVYSASAYAPFGEQYAVSGTADASFTGQNSDTNSSLYDFTFRELTPSQGRWLSPDPAGLAATDLNSPQSWNRYAYVMNAPLSLVDPFGLCPDGTYCITSGSCSVDQMSYQGQCVPYCPASMGLAYVDGWIICGPPANIDALMQQASNNANACPQGNCGPSNAANNCQAPFLCNPVHQIGPPQQYRPAKQPSKLSNYVAFLGCEYNSVVETITDEEDGQGWTAYGFINAGAIISLRSGIGATPVGLVFVATAGAMDVGAMAKANKECTEQIYH